MIMVNPREESVTARPITTFPFGILLTILPKSIKWPPLSKKDVLVRPATTNEAITMPTPNNTITCIMIGIVLSEIF